MLDKKVIFVDDSLTMRRIILNALKKIGFNNITEAENGLDALEKMEKQEFDLVLTDWNMPEMNGEQFVKELRSKEKYKKLPILMVTTRGMKDDVITAVKLGVNGYVVKPFTPEILKGKINDVISKL